MSVGRRGEAIYREYECKCTFRSITSFFAASSSIPAAPPSAEEGVCVVVPSASVEAGFPSASVSWAGVGSVEYKR